MASRSVYVFVILSRSQPDYPKPELGSLLGDEVRDLVEFRYVERDSRGFIFAMLMDEILQCFLSPANHDDMGTLFDHTVCQRCPDPARGSYNKDSFVRKWHFECSGKRLLGASKENDGEIRRDEMKRWEKDLWPTAELLYIYMVTNLLLAVIDDVHSHRRVGCCERFPLSHAKCGALNYTPYLTSGLSCRG